MVADEDAAQKSEIGYRKFIPRKASSKVIAQLNPEDEKDKEDLTVICDAVKEVAKTKSSGSLSSDR